MWIQIGSEHVNLDGASSILEIEGGYEIRHGRAQYTSITAPESMTIDAPVKPSKEIVRSVLRMGGVDAEVKTEDDPLYDAKMAMYMIERKKYDTLQESYLNNKIIIEQIKAFLDSQEKPKAKRASKAKIS